MRVKLDLTSRGADQLGRAQRPFVVEIKPRIKARASREPGWQLHGVIASRVTLDALYLHFGDTPVHGESPFVRPVVATVHVPDARPLASVSPDLATVNVSARVGVPGEYELAIAPRPTLAPGPFQCRVNIDLVTAAGERLPGVELPVTGTMQPEVRALPARLIMGPRRLGQTAEAVVTLQSPPGQEWRVDHIETASEDTRVEPVQPAGKSGSASFRVRQRIALEGPQSSMVRFFVRRGESEPQALAMEVCYDGDVGGLLSGPDDARRGP